jgi:hypothetical protein
VPKSKAMRTELLLIADRNAMALLDVACGSQPLSRVTLSTNAPLSIGSAGRPEESSHNLERQMMAVCHDVVRIFVCGFLLILILTECVSMDVMANLVIQSALDDEKIQPGERIQSRTRIIPNDVDAAQNRSVGSQCI